MTQSVAQLSIYHQQVLLKKVLLDQPLTSLGSDTNNVIVLSQPTIAPHHLEILREADHYQIRDLGSPLGLQLNHQAIEPHHLYPLTFGDTIQLGDLECQFQELAIATPDPEPNLPGTVATFFERLTVLQVVAPNWMQEFPLRQDFTTIGQDPSNDIVIDQPSILPHHAQVVRTSQGHRIESLSPQAMLRLHGQPISQHELTSGDLIQVGNHFSLTYLVIEPQSSQIPTAGVLNLRERKSLSIGRDPRNDTVIDHPTVSRFHVRIELKQGSWAITDLETSNGTFVNGIQISGDRILKAGDRIRIGPCEFILSVDETLIQQNEAGNLRLDALHLCKETAKGITLLDDISISILPREFVAIVGVSGAGKSTLLDALNGLRPATSGTVLVNDHDLYKNFNAYRTEVGYVPQEDIIHRELTVLQALDFAAQLRLPADTTRAERRHRVQRVLDDLELSHRQHVVVKQLSGGQRKRVSMGVELLTEPSLFFLDEATSGLDPGTELQMMRLLRKLADQGRTILLITHATKNVMMCNMVLFLTKGGRVAYFGPPDQALTYFGVQDFDEIYLKVEGDLSPEIWKQSFLASPHYQNYVVDRQKAIPIQGNTHESVSLTTQLPSQTKGISAWRQWLILSQRYIATLLQERVSLLLMLSLAPILGLLDWVMWQRSLFDNQDGDGGQAFTMMFLSVLIATIVGSLGTMREIVKEVDIYRRERMVGLKIMPYAFSKLFVIILLALYQSAIFLLTKELAVAIPGGWSTVTPLYITMFLVTLGGMVMGLLVSALSSNQNVAPILTVFFLIPQITFAGSILPLQDVGVAGRFLSQLTVTRWSYEAFVTISGVGHDIALDPCWQKTKAERDNLTEAQKQSCSCLGAKLFKHCDFPGILEQYDPAVDQPEPQKPKDPGDPPNAPDNPFDLETVYRDDLNNYNTKVKDYKKKIDQWQDAFGTWKSKRGTAIASAEAILGRFHRNQGNAFNVNVHEHWLKLVGLIAGMFCCLMLAQKRKDVL